MDLGKRLWNDIIQNESLIKDSLNIVKKQHGIITEAQLKIVKENLRDMITYVQILMSNKSLDSYRNHEGETLLKDLLEDAESALKFLKKTNYSYYDSELVRLVEKLTNKLQEYLEEVKSDTYYRSKDHSKKYYPYEEYDEKLTQEHLVLCELCDEIRRKDKTKAGKVIVELIVEMCVRSPSDTVLDPGCGSGSFLVKSYHKLKDLKKKENPFRSDSELHKDLLGQIYGIDINPFPAQLSSINLAVRNLEVRSDTLNLIVSDFFKVKPGMFPLPKEFDIVVTNPPYTRQEEMEYKDQIREEALIYSDGTEIDISAQAGIYAYFFTHSAKFLKNKGRMGYITSNTWLDVSFGEALKQFFLDHFKIVAIIEHDAGVFEKAVVDTCVVILEKAEGAALKKEREQNTVKFIRIKKPTDIRDLLKLIEEATKDYENEKIRLILRKQSKLEVEEKWGNYLRAPKVYYEIIQSPIMTKLGKITKVRRGYTTGAEEFFYLDADKIRLWGIEKDYYKPVLTNPRKIQSIRLSSTELDEYLLTVNETKIAIQGKNVAKYIEHGESLGYHLRQTTRTRKLWYSLAERAPYPIVIHRFIRERIIIAWNDIKAFIDDSFYEVSPNIEEEMYVLLGYLSSLVLELIIELHGRLYGAGLFEIKAYELKNLPTIDPEKLSEREKTRVRDFFLEYCDAQKTENQKTIDDVRKELDNVIFDILGLTEDERRQVYEGLESLRKMRLSRKEVEVLVETGEEWRPAKKTKKTKETPIEPSKRLDFWMRE